ncbi:MAG: hypothetical protein JXM70_23810 [Pirellulales bacterium]|nr:hypothetical protein [Pirellulales bacterium]
MSWRDWFFSFRGSASDSDQKIDQQIVDAISAELERQERCREIFGQIRLKSKFTMPSWEGFCFPTSDDESQPPTSIIALFEVHGDRANGDVSVSFDRSESKGIEIHELEISVHGSDEVIWLISRLSPEQREEVIRDTEQAMRSDDEDQGPP